jgi:parvulin-like peptidyl-prolyl isomerase
MFKVHRAAQLTTTILVVVAAVLFTACNKTGGAAGNGEVAATVNGKNITMAEVDTLLSQQARGQQSQMSPLELAAARMQILDELIKQEVLFQRAEKEKLLPTEDEITQTINQQKLQAGMTEEQFQARLKETGQTEQALRETVRKQLAVQRLTDKLSSQIKINDKEVEDYFNHNRARYVAARGVGLSVIVVDPADNGAQNDAKGDTEAKQKIDLIYQRLNNKGDFATIAREQSEDAQTVLRGGDLGFLPEEQLKQGGIPADLAAKFFGSMEIGAFTEPVKLSNGQWAIFKLTDRRLQTENLTLDNPEVRKDISDTLVNARGQILTSALIETATNESKITNNLAQKMLESPQNFGTMRPAGSATPMPAATQAPQAAASPKAAASPAASPAKK